MILKRRGSVAGVNIALQLTSGKLVVWKGRSQLNAVVSRTSGNRRPQMKHSLNAGGVVDSIRKALGGCSPLSGAYYCALGVFILARLSDITRQWIERSGDPEFKYDYSLFIVLGALGATSIAVLGWRTVVNGLATACGRHPSWLGTTIGALPLHLFWFLHRIIGAGVLDREGQIVAT